MTNPLVLMALLSLQAPAGASKVPQEMLPTWVNTLQKKSDANGSFRAAWQDGYAITAYDRAVNGLTVEDLVALLPRTDAIPGFRCDASPIHTTLEATATIARASRIFRAPGPDPRARIDVTIEIFKDATAAQQSVDKTLFGFAQLSPERRQKVRDGALPHGTPIGDAYWVDNYPSNRGNILAKQGRVVFTISTNGLTGNPLAVTEPLARATQYRIQASTTVTGNPVSSLSPAKGVSTTKLNGMDYASLSQLKQAGVRVQLETVQGKSIAILSYGSAQLKISAWQDEASLNGKSTKLASTPFPNGDEMVVPYASVSSLLGLR